MLSWTCPFSSFLCHPYGVCTFRWPKRRVCRWYSLWVYCKSWLSISPNVSYHILFFQADSVVSATISSVLRMQCFFEIGSFDPKDPIRSMWLPWVYYSVEIPLAIICCSAPSMAPAFSRLRTSAVGEYMEAFLSRTFRFQTSSKWNTKHDRSMKSTESTEIIRKAVYDEVTVCQGGQAASGR